MADNFPEERGSDALAQKKPARKRAKRAPTTPRTATTKRTRQVQQQTSESIANAQTVEQLALRRWAAEVGSNVLSTMSAIMDELLQAHLLDDDDEEADDGQRDGHHEREKKLLDEAITAGLDSYPSFEAVNNLPLNSDPDIARVAAQLRDALTKCLIGATEFEGDSPVSSLRAWSSATSRRPSRRIRSTADTCAMRCRDWTSRNTAAGAAPHRRGRSLNLPVTRATAGWTRSSPADGCVSPKIGSTPRLCRIDLATRGKVSSRAGAITT